MKLRSKVSIKVFAALALSLLAVSAFAQRTVDRVAQVNALAGDAAYSSKDGAWVPLAVGTKLYAGDKVKTGAGSHVDIDIGGNVGIVQVAPKSLFIIDKITSTDGGSERITETQLKVEGGAIYAKINRLAKGSRYEISTPKGIAGIRGTAVYCTADCQVTVVDGMAGVAYPNGGGADTFIVHSGETVGPNDRPPHPAPPELLRDIVEALRDASTHGVGLPLVPFVPPVDIFISPTLPVNFRPGAFTPDIPPID
jgi:hypothetical protein